MAALSWPVGVPQQQRPGSWQLLKPFKDPLSTPLDDGLQRRRPSTTKNIASIGFGLIPMTGAKFIIFKLWVRDDMFNGSWADGFWFNVWTGNGYEARICHFSAIPPYVAQPEGFDQASAQPLMAVSFPSLDVEDW